MSKTVYRRDPQSLAAARASAQGDPMPRVTRESAQPTEPKKIITDFEKEVEISGQILAGVLGFPPIVFGVEMEVGTRGGKDGKKPFPVIVFLDATTDCPLFGQLRQGFWIPLSYLRVKLDDVQFRGLDDRLFATYLSTQKAVQVAKQRHWEKNKAAQMATKEDEKKNLIAQMLASQKQNRAERPAPKEFGASLLGDEFGEYRHPSGVVLLLYKSERFDNRLISVVECPDEHELTGAMKARAFVHQAHVKDYPAELPGKKLEGILGKAQELRVWLRRELRAIDALPPLEEKAEGEASTATEVLATAPATATAVAPASVEAPASVAATELTSVLPAGTQVLSGENVGKQFPAKPKGRGARLTTPEPQTTTTA